MNIRKTLLALARVLSDECETNAPFRKALTEVLGSSQARSRRPTPSTVRRPHRRASPLLDPIELVGRGSEALDSELRKLDIEQLKDIVASFGMDPSKLVMKWKDRERVMQHIIETSTMRATKGDAFRG